jgi:hypothetical protein
VRTPAGAAWALIGVLATTPAAAAVRCVRPNGAGGCSSTIQAAVDAAAAGDLVSIGAGIYFENVVVPPGKDGLQLVGASPLRTVIDPDHPLNGSGIVVASNRVRVMKIGIRNGQATGITVSNADGVVVQSVRIVGVRGLRSAGIFADTGSDGVQILSSEVRAVSWAGIEVLGAGAVVSGNTVSHVRNAIYAIGANPRVALNRITGGSIRMAGNGGTVLSNTVELAEGRGIDVSSINPTVQGNKVTNAGEIAVECLSCTGALVSGNVSLGSPTFAFRLTGEGAGFLAQANTASRAVLAAFFLEGSVEAIANRAFDTGVANSPASEQAAGHCFSAAGTGPHRLVGNSATQCAVSGFMVRHRATLERNVATQAGVHGFTVGPMAADTVVAGNSAVAANGAGYAVLDGAQDTALSLNTGSRNRYDLCDEGVGTTTVSNTFAAVSSACDVAR